MSRRPLGPWLFGKLPAQGDFVTRGLEPPLRDGLDRWLSAQMEAAMAAFPDFDQRYRAAPAWNYVDVDPDERWTGGVLCASIDRVGRSFPVIMGMPAADAAEAARLSGACMAALQRAFAEGWDADDLLAADMPPAEMPWNPVDTEWALLGEEGPAVVLHGRFPQAAVMTMLEGAL